MNWKKSPPNLETDKGKKSDAASVTCDTHGMHRSLKSKDDISVTVYRRKPSYKLLGSVGSFKEGLELAEKDYEEFKKEAGNDEPA